MQLEGSYLMKPPCYNSSLENKDSTDCLKGSIWSEKA